MRVIQSEKGAALILVLFLVVFLSIAGTMMLTSTTYSQRTIDTQIKEQEEFYRAEGTLDLALANLTPETLVEKEVGSLLESYVFQAGSNAKKTGVFLIGKTENKYRIMAKDKDKSTIQRVLEIEVEVNNDSLNDKALIFGNGKDEGKLDLRDPNDYHTGKNLEDFIKQNSNTYSILKERIKNQGLEGYQEENHSNIDIAGQSNETIGNGENKVVYINEITLRGDAKIHIKANTIVIVKSKVTVNGGNDSGTIVIEKGAALLTAEYHNNGNPGPVNINGGMVAGEITSSGNSQNTINFGEEPGLPLILIGTLANGGNGSGNLIPTNYYTERNTY